MWSSESNVYTAVVKGQNSYISMADAQVLTPFGGVREQSTKGEVKGIRSQRQTEFLQTTATTAVTQQQSGTTDIYIYIFFF